MLVAYVDDSVGRRDDERLFLAGYVTRADIWDGFRAAWIAELRRAPAISSFHMVEAQNLRGPFKGWAPADRDAKVMALARLVGAFRLFSFECSVSLTEHRALFPGKVPFGLARPYGLCAHGVAANLARHFHAKGFRDPISFVFDTQEGADKDLTAIWPWIRAASPGPWRDLLGEAPRFVDDREDVALQAADLLVWHLRRTHDETDPPGAFPAADLVHGELHLASHIDRDRLRTMVLGMGQIPGVPELVGKADWKKVRGTIETLNAQGKTPPPRVLAPPNGVRSLWRGWVGSPDAPKARPLPRHPKGAPGAARWPRSRTARPD